jgi:hypothetical protein
MRIGYSKTYKERVLRSVQIMSGNAQAIMKQFRATYMPFACFEMNAGSVTPIKCRSIVEASVMTPVSFFVIVLLSVLLVLVRLVVVRCLTGLVKLYGLVGLTTSRASAAGKGV